MVLEIVGPHIMPLIILRLPGFVKVHPEGRSSVFTEAPTALGGLGSRVEGLWIVV